MVKADYRIRIIDGSKNQSYIVRKNERVNYISASETPLALSNLVQDKAAELRFDLEDARNADDAAIAVRKILAEMWRNNPPLKPSVEII